MPPPIQAVGTPAHTFAATDLHLAACLCVASSSSAKVAGLVVAKPVKPAASSTNVLLRIKRHRGQSKSHPPPIGDIVGLIVYLGPLQHVYNRLYREVTLLNTRGRQGGMRTWGDATPRNEEEITWVTPKI
uniref:Uncharacterized protein n=1 Tax=Oryza rufipogon TaxID=4529 RepID=A0A0E0PKU4_ORYRU